MDTNINPDQHTGAGIAGGVVLVLLNVTTLQLMETILLAVLGAAVSFTTSVALKLLMQRLRGQRGEREEKRVRTEPTEGRRMSEE